MGWRPPRSTSVLQRPYALTVRALAKDRSALSFLRFPARDCADSPGNAPGGLFERLQILLAGLPQDGRIRFVVIVAEERCRYRRSLSTGHVLRLLSTLLEGGDWLPTGSRGFVQRVVVHAGLLEIWRNRNLPCLPRCSRWPRGCDEGKYPGLSPSEGFFRFAKDSISDCRTESLPCNDVDLSA